MWCEDLNSINFWLSRKRIKLQFHCLFSIGNKTWYMWSEEFAKTKLDYEICCNNLFLKELRMKKIPKVNFTWSRLKSWIQTQPISWLHNYRRCSITKRHCIQRELFCDGQTNCENKTNEINCKKTTQLSVADKSAWKDFGPLHYAGVRFIFKASALWTDAFYKSIFPCVRVFVHFWGTV